MSRHPSRPDDHLLMQVAPSNRVSITFSTAASSDSAAAAPTTGDALYAGSAEHSAACAQRPILSRGHADAATELSRCIVRVDPADLSSYETDGAIRLTQQDGHALDADHRQVRDWCLAVGIYEHATEL